MANRILLSMTVREAPDGAPPLVDMVIGDGFEEYREGIAQFLAHWAERWSPRSIRHVWESERR